MLVGIPPFAHKNDVRIDRMARDAVNTLDADAATFGWPCVSCVASLVAHESCTCGKVQVGQAAMQPVPKLSLHEEIYLLPKCHTQGRSDGKGTLACKDELPIFVYFSPGCVRVFLHCAAGLNAHGVDCFFLCSRWRDGLIGLHW